MKNNKLIFITGPGRCGTNLILSFLDGNKNFNIFPGEITNFFQDSIFKNCLTKKVFSFNTNYLLDIFFKELYFYNKYSKKNLKKIKKKIQAKLYYKKSINLDVFLNIIIKEVFKNNKITVINIQDENILGLLDAFPNSKVIHMLRNPFNQINSRYYFRYRSPNNYNGDEFGNSFYRNYNAFKNAYLCKNNKDVKIVKLEKLILDHKKELKKIFKFLKIKIEKINYSTTLFKKEINTEIYYKNYHLNSNFKQKKISSDLSCLLPNDLYIISNIKFVTYFYKLKKYKFVKSNFFSFYIRHLGLIGNNRKYTFNIIKFIKLSIYSIYLYFLDNEYKKKFINHQNI